MQNELYKVINGDRYELLYSTEQILEKVMEIARHIAFDFKDINERPILMFVVTGGLYFGVDLSRALSSVNFEHAIDMVGLKRYGDAEKGGVVQMNGMPRANLGGRDIIVIEDVIDQGLTMNFFHRYLLGLEAPPRSISYCALLLKTNHEPLDFMVNYCGWEIGPDWIVGYGMDSAQLYRGLDGIYVKCAA